MSSDVWKFEYDDSEDELEALTRQPSAAVTKAGADRIRSERALFKENGWGEPSDEHLAANAYEAMVFFITKRGLRLDDADRLRKAEKRK